MRRHVWFEGRIGGKGECFFCWLGVSETSMRRLTGGYDPEDDRANILYPDEVMEALNCELGVKYLFKISAEVVFDPAESDE